LCHSESLQPIQPRTAKHQQKSQLTWDFMDQRRAREKPSLKRATEFKKSTNREESIGTRNPLHHE
jgi:hypothetical protein